MTSGNTALPSLFPKNLGTFVPFFFRRAYLSGTLKPPETFSSGGSVHDKSAQQLADHSPDFSINLAIRVCSAAHRMRTVKGKP